MILVEASRLAGAQPAAAASIRSSGRWLHLCFDRDADIFECISGPSKSSPGAHLPDSALQQTLDIVELLLLGANA